MIGGDPSARPRGVILITGMDSESLALSRTRCNAQILPVVWDDVDRAALQTTKAFEKAPLVATTGEELIRLMAESVGQTVVIAGNHSLSRFCIVADAATRTRSDVAFVVAPNVVRLTPIRIRSSSAKRMSDVAIAAILALLGLPLWILIAVLVRLDSRGPSLFIQDRIGLNGRRFRMWKFRTLRREARAYAKSPSGDDPLVTRFGRLLRASGLDEAAQLVNVLRGEMSLIGPRPEMPYIVEEYASEERLRLEALPGLSGLWQLYGNRANAMHEQLELDLAYIAFRSLALDLRLLGATLVFPFRAFARNLARRTSIDAPLERRTRL